MTRAAAAAAGLVVLVLTGCPAPRAVVRPAPSPIPIPITLAPASGHEELAIAGVVHVVRRGETIYRIAKAYGIAPADLMETNGISDPRAVAVGAELFVPGAAAAVDVPPAPDAPAAGASGAVPRASLAEPVVSLPPPPAPSAAALPAGPAGRVPLAWPLRGVLYGRFGVRAGERHDGIDIAAPEGTLVGAAAAGTVLYAGEQAGYGAIVILRHEGGLVTLYAHASAVLVREGARVARGQPIAKVGQTGRTTGPHLHFEVREGTRPRNPLLFLP